MPRSIALLLLVAACQTSDGAEGRRVAKGGPVTPAYAADIATMCDAVTLSGADKDPGGRVVIVANYLAAHLRTPESRTFMISLQAMNDAAKARAFDDEAHRVGLANCAVSELWRHPPKP